ncbi:MAG: hypothetical protein Q9226_002191 [Calogaya cf. arnoldii]
MLGPLTDASRKRAAPGDSGNGSMSPSTDIVVSQNHLQDLRSEILELKMETESNLKEYKELEQKLSKQIRDYSALKICIGDIRLHEDDFGGNYGRPAIMTEGNESTSTATAAVELRERTEEDLRLSQSESTDSPLAWHPPSAPPANPLNTSTTTQPTPAINQQIAFTFAPTTTTNITQQFMGALQNFPISIMAPSSIKTLPRRKWKPKSTPQKRESAKDRAIGSGARPAIMAEGNDFTSTATAAAALREGTEENLKSSQSDNKLSIEMLVSVNDGCLSSVTVTAVQDSPKTTLRALSMSVVN